MTARASYKSILLKSTQPTDRQTSQSPLSLPKFTCDQPCVLSDVLFEAPALLATVPCQDWNALAGCNRQLRTFIHSSVQAITINHTSDFSSCVKGMWPQLALLKFKPVNFSTTSGFPEWPAECNFQLLASLCRVEGDDKVVAQLVRCRKQLLEINCHRHIAAALSHLCGSGWQHIASLAVKVHVEKPEVVKQIACLDLPQLLDLTFASSRLGAATMQELSKGRWPNLQQLELSNILIGEAAMKALVLGSWPSLTGLHLTDSPLLDATVISLIPQAPSWVSLKVLNLLGTKLDVAGARAVTLLNERLRHLWLKSTDLQLTGMSQLFSVSWPHLQGLGLEYKLGADAIVVLTSASLPNLNELCLSHNLLTDADMASLAKGQWPKSRHMSVRGNMVSAVGVKLLSQGEWPQLDGLWLDSMAVSTATWKVLDLVGLPATSVALVPDVVRGACVDRGVRVHRCCHAAPFWPKLRVVNFAFSALPL